jgi:hypothetical protein
MCGAEPDLVEISTANDAQPRYVPGRWPPAEDGHQHAAQPPTPGQLEQAGHEALMRIRRAGS